MFRNCYIKSSERVKHSWLKRTKQRRHARPLNEKGQQFIIMLRSATVRLLIIIIIVWVLKTKIKIINQEFAQSTRVAINWLSLGRDRSKWTIWYSIKCCLHSILVFWSKWRDEFRHWTSLRFQHGTIGAPNDKTHYNNDSLIRSLRFWIMHNFIVDTDSHE